MVYVREAWKIGKGRRTSEGNLGTELYSHTQSRDHRGEGYEASSRLPASPKISVAQEWQSQGAKNRRVSPKEYTAYQRREASTSLDFTERSGPSSKP